MSFVGFSPPILLLAAVPAGCGAPETGNFEAGGNGWPRHVIDDSSLGADGVRTADIDGDGRLDITSPWEQGGQVRVYLNPGESGVRERWPAVTVGEVGDPEDSFFVDLDGDGNLDVVSSCEGETRAIYVHWAPADRSRLLDADAWTTEELPAAAGAGRWMFAFAMQVDGKAGVDLIAGAKGEDAWLGWFEAPEDPRDLHAWRLRPLYRAGWLMTLRPSDIDGDGDLDIVATDRRGPRRGAFWLENPGAAAAAAAPWTEHRIGAVNAYEAMHNAVVDLDGDGLEDVLVAVKREPVRYHRRTARFPPAWETHAIAMPTNAGGGKAVRAADIDLDGRLDLVVSCEHADDGKSGVIWLSYDREPTEEHWRATSISGPEGFIFDLVQIIDLDEDGDPDVVTLEEKGPYLARGYQGRELGVVWYENPAR